MKILLLTHYYWPEIGAPQRRWSTLVKHFVAGGHRVVVAAPHPHYPHKRRDDFFKSSVGRKRIKVQARLGGTWEAGEFGEKIIRVPYLHSNTSMARQMLDQAVSATGVVNAVLRRMRGSTAPDVIISTTPALPFLLAGDSLSRTLDVPHIAEVRDAWPDLIRDLGLVTNAAGGYMPERVSGFLEDTFLPNVLTRAQRRASCVVVTTDKFSAHLRRRGINAEVVRSGVSQSEIEAAAHKPPEKHELSSGLNLLYVGTVGRSQNLGCVIEAAARVPGVQLRIVGDGADKRAMQVLADKLRAPVSFYDQMTGSDLAAQWEWSDAGLVSLGDVPAHHRTVPSKLYSLMVRKVPVLGVVAGEAADIITQNEAGLVARPGEIESVVDTMQTMSQTITQPNDQSRRWVVDNASAGVMGEKYDRILRQVCR